MELSRVPTVYPDAKLYTRANGLTLPAKHTTSTRVTFFVAVPSHHLFALFFPRMQLPVVPWLRARLLPARAVADGP